MSTSPAPLVNELSPEIKQGIGALDPGTESGAGAAGSESTQSVPESWEPVVVWAFDTVREMLSTWNWTPNACKMISQGGTDLLNLYFPGGPANWEHWGPWAKLLAGIGLFGAANAARLKALHKQDKVANDGRKADGGDGANAQRQDAQHPPGNGTGTPAAGV